jgi:formiminotetrahydrofolate cyclodeaminase
VASSLGDKSLRDVLAALAGDSPTPGGGSACAAASAMGAALLMMAAARAGVAQHTLAGIEQQLTEAIDGDAAAYTHVIAAMKQPHESQADRASRTAAIQLALRHATDVPLSVLRLSADALNEARLLAPHVRRSTIADAAVAVTLVGAGFEGARRTVEANLAGLRDTEYILTVRDECLRLSEQAMQASAEADRLLLRVG